jgi:hypothetical protein
MGFEIRQSTAVVLSFGPFVAPSDGVTLVTSLVSALDNASTGIMLSKNGGANAVRHATVTSTTYDAYGMYRVTLDTTDTNTLGTLKVSFAAAASCMPVWQDVEVIAQSSWDAKYGTGNYPANTAQIAGAAVSTSTAQIGVNVISKATACDFSTTEKASLDTEVTNQLTAIGLQYVLHTTLGGSKPTIGSLFDLIMNNDSSQLFSQANDSLHAVTLNTATASQVAGLTMDQVLASHSTAGTAGAALIQAALLAFTSGRVNANVGAIESAVDFTTTMKGDLAAPSDIATAVNTAALVSIKKNTAFAKFTFKMRDATSHVASPSMTVTVTRSIDGGAFGAGALSAVTEISNGLYRVDLAAADLNGSVIVLRCAATNCETLDVVIYPVG